MMIFLLSATLAMGHAAGALGSGPAVATPAACDHAINTKGTGTSGRAAGTELAIKTKGTGAQRTAGTEMAIKTKGTGAQRTALAIKTKGTGAQRAITAAGATDCDDADAK